ncbi:MAG: outer membrane protein assembly factor BamD [Bdellovibrionales bacterium]|nr:outer membrane protein assembly factor BamD [Bdellovibrionales bacterium]
MRLRAFTTTLAFAAVGFLFAGCSSDSVKDSDNPEVIYNAAMKYIDRERYIDATDHFNEIRHRFPQSRFAALAELRTGDMEFKQENYTEAAAAYKVFVELYPNHAEAAYGQYQRALAYYNDTPEKTARDQSPARDAIEAAQQVITRYPQSEYVTKAKELIIKGRQKLAEKEAYVARFYERKEAYDSALKRWQGIVRDYGDLKDGVLKDLIDEAQRKIVELTKKS